MRSTVRHSNSKNKQRRKQKKRRTGRDTSRFSSPPRHCKNQEVEARTAALPRRSPPKAGDQRQRVRSPFFLGARKTPFSTRLKLPGLEDLAAKDFRRWRGKLGDGRGRKRRSVYLYLLVAIRRDPTERTSTGNERADGDNRRLFALVSEE